MSEQTPEQKMIERIDDCKDKIEKLQSDVRLSDLHDQVEDLDTKVKGFLPCVRDLREQGYQFGKGFEAKAEELAKQWSVLYPKIASEVNRQTPSLQSELRPLEGQLTAIQGVNPLSVRSAVDRLESALNTLESKVEAVEQNIKGMFDSLESEINEFKGQLDQVGEMLEKFASAAAAGSFRLLPTEGAVMAVKATYSRDQKMDKDDPQGFFFLTDQRLLFEQNQEIATKKVLFITTEKQKVQKLLFEAPVALIEQVQASKKGLFGNEDHLALTFKSGAPVYQAWLHLDGQDCNEWQSQIGRARSGDFANERAVAIDQAQVDKVKAAPTQCSNCGAPITQTVLRGMDSIECEYCKHVIRL
jgi:predicted  nucleic acid-binding Zn-ribbon protein